MSAAPQVVAGQKTGSALGVFSNLSTRLVRKGDACVRKQGFQPGFGLAWKLGGLDGVNAVCHVADLNETYHAHVEVWRALVDIESPSR